MMLIVKYHLYGIEIIDFIILQKKINEVYKKDFI